MAEKVDLSEQAWHEYARWWDVEADRVEKQYHADGTALKQVESQFGKIGEDTTTPAFQELLGARMQTGQALGDYCRAVAAHVRHNVQQYRDTEAASQRSLTT